MTGWVKGLRRRAVAAAAWLAAVSLVSAAWAETNVSAAGAANLASDGGLPQWMGVSTLATGVTEWAELAAIWRRQPDEGASPVTDFTLPIEHYENGRIRAVLHAGKASIGRSGFIWSWQVAVEMFDPEGRPDGRVDAESCLYDRNTRRGYCPAGVQLVRTNVTISGTGLYWTMDNQRMQILSNPVVRVRRGVTFSGGWKK